MVFGSQSSIPHTFNPNDSDTEGFLEPKTQQPPSTTEEKDGTKPLLQCIGNSKNASGSKIWVCSYCKMQCTSSYTRIHTHFFGAPRGKVKKADIKRCRVLIRDHDKYVTLLNKGKLAQDNGVFKSLKNSVVNKSKTSSSKKSIEEAFGVMERSMVDLKITKGLCANGIPFNVLRNPHFLEMVRALKKAPDGYMPPSSEKTRTVLLNECVRDVEKELTPFQDTWYSQGLSIVSDGRSNVKHNPLINVLAVNSRGAMFMHAEDFSVVEKTGVVIANFLQGDIETVGARNVLQVVTDNAPNCKAA